jgi:tetratricopeptide (TPR) repeat protein
MPKADLSQLFKLDEKSLSILDKQYKLTDPFVIHVFSSWRTKAIQNNQFNEWMDLFLSEKLEDALKKYQGIRSEVPAVFIQEFALIEFYLLEKVGQTQIFFDRWLPYYYKNKAQQPLATLFDQLISMKADLWLFQNKPFVNAEIAKLLDSNGADTSRFVLMSKIWRDRVKKDKILDHLALLPLGSPLKIDLGFRAVYFLAKEGKLAEAGKILKTQVWPEVKNSGDPLVLAKYYMNIARLLYQAGADQAALEFYQKIPSSLALYLDAQSEMSWIYLRMGEFEKAQAISRKLNSKALDDFFNPEFYLVESISDLKRCRFEEVRSNLNQFSKSNQDWIKKSNSHQFKPSDELQFLESMRANLARQEVDSRKLGHEYASFSVYAKSLDTDIVKQKNLLTKIHQQMIEKAFFKMRFVKIAQLSYQDAVARNKAPKKSDKVEMKLSATANDKSLVFPKDGVFWPDEVMAEEVEAQDYCVRK